MRPVLVRLVIAELVAAVATLCSFGFRAWMPLSAGLFAAMYGLACALFLVALWPTAGDPDDCV